MTRRFGRWVAVASVLVAAACGSDASSPVTDAAEPGTEQSTSVVTADGISQERCEANRAAGTITYLSGFDLAATASIIEVVMADESGYFEDMCLDVEVRASFSTVNYPLVGANTAQFASSGSFNEMLNASTDVPMGPP